MTNKKHSSKSLSTINIGIFGLGTVGSGVVDLLHKNRNIIWERCRKNFRITKAVVRQPNKKRSFSTRGISLSSNPDHIFKDPNIDVIIELVGGRLLPEKIFRYCIKNQKPLITANKAFLAEQSSWLGNLFIKNRTCIGMEASVAGAVPILQALRYGLSANDIESVYGIVNGTANYILTAMQKNQMGFQEALKQAQQLGYAEEDPTFDIKGNDSAHKLAILMGLAFHHRFDYNEITKEGIHDIDPIDFIYAKEFGYVLKLLAIAKKTKKGYQGGVYPTLIPKNTILASVNNENNAIQVFGNYSGSMIIYGKGAGSNPTASAVVSDLVGMYEYEDIHSPLDPLNPPEERYFFENSPSSIVPLYQVISKFYIRFKVKDQIGVMSAISNILTKEGISISQMIQKRIPEQNHLVNLTLITNDSLEQNIMRAIKNIAQKSFVHNRRYHCYRIEHISDE